MGLDPSLAGAFIDGGAGGSGFTRQRVLGVRLRRFSLWHLLLLQTLDSPFLRHGEVGLEDLRTAVGICRLPFEDSRVRRPWLGPRALWRLCRKGGLREEIMAFLAYTADFLHKPEYSIRAPNLPSGASGMRGHSAPQIMQVAADVLGLSHWPERYLWELPPGRAYWYQAMAQRALGADVDFMNDEDRAFNEAMKQAGLKPKAMPPEGGEE